mgnify:CR=1 FL=1
MVFRESGISLEKIALFLPALYLPWMLKFVWSIFVEKFHLENYGKYRSWIVPLQVLTAGVMVALSNWQLGSSVALFVLAVALINIFSSIQDVATDGQAVQLLERGERGLGNAVQVGAFAIGYIIGGGLILMLIVIVIDVPASPSRHVRRRGVRRRAARVQRRNRGRCRACPKKNVI